MTRILIFLVCVGASKATFAQFRHYDFLGAGHNNEVVVTSSSSATVASGAQTVDGFPIKNDIQLKDASRFLAQATFGADYSTIEMTAAMGYEAWLDEQFLLPQQPILKEMEEQARILEGSEFEEGAGIFHVYFRSSWMTQNLTTADVLRQRMAFNLSQLMVINDNSDFFEDIGQVIGTYYDMLGTNAFKNYQTLLTDVTLSPAMGSFLSHYNNPKADPSRNIHPDENYAREIMQLFSIGLWELNSDGTRKRDSAGNFIPTYTNTNIKEFAQVFTGLSDGTANGQFGGGIGELEDNITSIVQVPMKMYDDFHDTSEKRLLNGVVLPANQAGMIDIAQTMEHLANHPNTAPFISKALIKMFTTSNPSPSYVSDVAAVFDPDKENNFQDVLKAILLHPQARNCNMPEAYTFGKLREPVVRLLNLLKAFNISTISPGNYFYLMTCFGANTGQSPLEAPSVFNFFLPDYAPPGPINQNYLVAPEFQIFNATNAIGLINDVNNRVIKERHLTDRCVGDDELEEVIDEEYANDGHSMDLSAELALTANAAELINRLDIILANGLLGQKTKTTIADAVDLLNTPEEKLKMAIYLILISPDYAIIR